MRANHNQNSKGVCEPMHPGSAGQYHGAREYRWEYNSNCKCEWRQLYVDIGEWNTDSRSSESTKHYCQRSRGRYRMGTGKLYQPNLHTDEKGEGDRNGKTDAESDV